MERQEEDEEVGSGEEPTSVGGACYPHAEAEYQQLVENGDLFLDKLRNFHSSFGTNFSLPSIRGTPLDLHRLFVEVTSRGGLDQVVRDRKWQEVISAVELPVNWSFVLRKHYMSLLYHFEQEYFFKKSGQTAAVAVGSVNLIPGNRSAEEPTEELHEESASTNHSPAGPELQPGVSLVGIIDEKFDNGYVVSVNLGFGQLKGILYHIPNKPQLSWSPNPYITQHQRREKSQLTLLDSSKSTTTGSSFDFFSKHYATPKPMSQGQEHVSKDNT